MPTFKKNLHQIELIIQLQQICHHNDPLPNLDYHARIHVIQKQILHKLLIKVSSIAQNAIMQNIWRLVFNLMLK